MLALLLPSLSLLAATPPAERPAARPLPSVAKAPRVDGMLKEWPSTPEAKASGATASFGARVVESRGTLYLAVEVRDDVVLPGDVLTAMVHFPSAGATALGHTFRFALDGKRASPPEEGTPAFAQELVKAAVKQGTGRLSLEAAFPARALPRFNVEGPLVLDLCVTYDDQDAVGAPPVSASTCKGGAPTAGSLRLPDAFRKALGIAAPKQVASLQGARGGWLGFGDLQFPRWAQAEARLTPPLLRSLVGAERSLEPAARNLPEVVQLPDGRPLVMVLSGTDPYTREGECDAEQELRLALYLVKGKQAVRALEWPAATCALGRVLSVVVDEEGALTLGYSSGASINFAWSGDHFERTEIGKR